MDNQMNQISHAGKSPKVMSAAFGLLMIVGLIGAGLQPALAARSGSEAEQVLAQAAPSSGATAVVHWNAIAVRTAIQVAGQNQPQSTMYLARVQAAVYNAVVAIEGRYQPYHSALTPRPGASVEAAVALAAHGVLVYDFPAQQAALDADLAAALAAVADGPAKSAGIEIGRAAAAELLALRQGDGLEADIGFTMPSPAPGVWQLPAGATPLSPWISRLRPYLLNSPDQFRPGPPPDLTSPEWAVQYEEVRQMGRATNSPRTDEQTDIARFWSTHAQAQYNAAYQQIIRTRGLDAVEAARLMAMGNLLGADALIGCFDAKYHYLFWRPLFAIRQGDGDGNPGTTGEPTWQPLLGTPPHPEYPSAHSCYTSSQAEVFVEVLGTQRIELDLTSTAPNVLQRTRHYKYARDLVQEIIDARVWGGIHYRESDVKGATLGRKVAHWALQRYFLPVP
ncbi:MAG TPA: vanadium-dependent haloperoxidase [Anaerolineales bacterium]|nr:vanadium-dependent haloperoxidase [Anaerolineales bacterium]